MFSLRGVPSVDSPVCHHTCCEGLKRWTELSLRAVHMHECIMLYKGRFDRIFIECNLLQHDSILWHLPGLLLV